MSEFSSLIQSIFENTHVQGKRFKIGSTENYKRIELSPQSLEETQVIFQQTYGFGGAQFGKRFLESIAADPCVIAVLYNKRKKIASMAHFGASDNTDVDKTLQEMSRGLGDDDLELKIFAGYKDNNVSQRIVNECRMFASYGHIQITEEDTLVDPTQVKTTDIIFDTDTGEAFSLDQEFDISKRYPANLINLMMTIVNHPSSMKFEAMHKLNAEYEIPERIKRDDEFFRSQIQNISD